MDTTPKYILMCEKAKEIQKEHPVKEWESEMYRINISTYDSEGSCWIKINNEYFIWVPRQDQLQGMVKYFKNLPPTEYSARGLLEAFWEFVDNNWIEYLWTLSNEQVSMEQLWLAFVMKEKYSKVWNGKDWVKK